MYSSRVKAFVLLTERQVSSALAPERDAPCLQCISNNFLVQKYSQTHATRAPNARYNACAVFALSLPCTGRKTAEVDLVLELSVARTPLPVPPAVAADVQADADSSTAAAAAAPTSADDDEEPLVVRVRRRKHCVEALMTPSGARDRLLLPQLSLSASATDPLVVQTPTLEKSPPAPGVGVGDESGVQVRAGREHENENDFDAGTQRRRQHEAAEERSSAPTSSSTFAYYIVVAASSSLLLLLACLLLCLFMQSRRRTLKSSAVLPVSVSAAAASTACNRRSEQRAAGGAGTPARPLTPASSPNVPLALSPAERFGSMRMHINPAAVVSLAATSVASRYECEKQLTFMSSDNVHFGT